MVIHKSLAKHSLDNLEIWVEPGRYLVAEAGIIGATVIGRTDKIGKPWLYLDASRFNCFTELFESEEIRYPILSSRDLSEHESGKRVTTVLTGPTCDSFDTIFTDVMLSNDVQEGDRIYFSTAGAYTHVYGSNFNDFPPPKVYVI